MTVGQVGKPPGAIFGEISGEIAGPTKLFLFSDLKPLCTRGPTGPTVSEPLL